MKNKILPVLILAVALAGGYYTVKKFSAGGEDPQAAMMAMMMGPAHVTTLTVVPRPVQIRTELPGRLNAYRVAEIRPQVSGIILKRLFEEGSTVTEGQQLYQIDPAPYQAAVNSARADLQRAEANIRSIESRAARYEELVKISAVSQQDYDDIVASLDQSKAAVAIAKAALDTARINLGYTKVMSPISGRIGKSSVTEGALVTANQPDVLTTVHQLDPIYVDVTQSSAELLKLRRQLMDPNSTMKQAGHDVTLYFDGSDTPYAEKGTLQFSDVTVDESTGAVQLRALFPNPQQELLPGLFVRAVIEQAVDENAILVPQRAVTRNPDGSASVWVVGEDNKVNPQIVTLADAMGDHWRVTGGLEGGERVVIEGLQKISPGKDVVATEFGTAPAGAPQPPHAE